MVKEIHTYNELLSEAERSYLVRKQDRERKVLLRTVRALAFAAVIVPGGLGMLMEYNKRGRDVPAWPAPEKEEDPYLFLYYIIGMLFLLSLVMLVALYTYTHSLKKLIKDIREGYKTIERTLITRKQFMPSTQTYHLYLSSRQRLSIEISKEEFDKYEVGDEINIEYSCHSKVYFGHF